MKKNIGSADRLLRAILGVLAFGFAFSVESNILKVVLIAFSLFCFYQALMGWCFLYQLLGKNTCPVVPDKK